MAGGTARRLAAAAAAALLLAVAGPASAAPHVVQLSPSGGGEPSAVTDAAGTLHAVWSQRPPGDPLNPYIAYCRVPAGAASCSPVELGPPPSGQVYGPPTILLRPSDGALVVLATDLLPPPGGGIDVNTTVAIVSTDGGITWSAPAVVGYGEFAVDHAVFTPDGAAIETYNVSPNPGTYQRVPLPGGAAEQRLIGLQSQSVSSGAHYAFDSDLGHLPDGRTIVVGSTPSARLAFRVLAPGADPFAPASWAPWERGRSPVEVDGPLLGSGPSGTWLEGTAGGQVRVWKWRAGSFVAAARLGSDGGPSTRTAFDVDPAGRRHVVWSRGSRRPTLVYRRSTPTGFTHARIYRLGRQTGWVVDHPVVSADAAGRGWIVWRQYPGGRVRAVALAARGGSMG